jgi:hypothetical protein
MVPGATLAASSECRVRNVSQDTTGRSLIRMVEKAKDGDLMRVRGTCAGEVVIRDDVVIEGRGKHPILTGRGRTRVVFVRSGATVMLRGLTVQRGRADAVGGSIWGGGIYNDGNLRLKDVVVRRNWSAFSGGGIGNGYEAELRIVHSRIRRNGAWLGGGVSNDIGEVRIVRSVIRENRATYGGGGIAQFSDEGGFVMVDSTIVGNRTRGAGAGIRSHGYVSLTRSSVRSNVAEGRGGGIFTSFFLGLRDSTIVDNSAGKGGGGIWDARGEYGRGTVSLDATSSVSGNVPDDCVGTLAC